MRRRAALLAALALPVAAQPAFLPTAEALALLRGGGLNLYMRHAITDRSQIDTGRRGDRAGQRNSAPPARPRPGRWARLFAATPCR